MDLLRYTFFQHALLGSLLASIACGIIGTYIVTRRLVFISGGITHASFGGIGLGLFAGISPILSAAVFSVLSAFGVEWLSRRKDMREDSAIAVFWTLGMALGIMFSFLSPGFAPDLSAYLFGNILTINQADLWMLGILALILTGFFYLFIRPIVYIAFDREFARSQKIPVEIFEYVLMMFIALTIVACLRMVGIVLAISLLTIPQMTANLFTYSFKKIIWLSIGIGFLGCLGGLFISYHWKVPSGASITKNLGMGVVGIRLATTILMGCAAIIFPINLYCIIRRLQNKSIKVGLKCNLKPSLYTITVLSFLNSFKVFREAYLVAGDYPHESIYMMQHLFNNWFRSFSFDKMAAAAVTESILLLGLILLLQKAWDGGNEDGRKSI